MRTGLFSRNKSRVYRTRLNSENKSFIPVFCNYFALLALLLSFPAYARQQHPAAGMPDEKNRKAATARPNVLFIAIDDLNDYISLLKDYPGIKTPNLDKFAKTALTFTRTYCAAPVCNPSRAALLSGMAPYRTGVYDNDNKIQDSPAILQGEFLPEHFKANGYITLTRGKIFHTEPDKARLDSMWNEDRGKGNYGPNTTEHNIPKSLKAPPFFDYQPWTGPESDHPDNVTAEVTIKRFGRNYDRPFFMACGLYKPHNPWTAPSRFFDMYPLEKVVLPKVLESDWDDLPPVAKKWAASPVNFHALKETGQWKAVVRSYLACISFMDWNLGRIMDALDKSGHRDNTIVCVFADNGFHMGEKLHFAKYALWEQTTHVLHMWRVPGMTQGGKVCDRTVNLLDLYPTLVDLCGLSPTKQKLDGRSIVPLLKNPETGWNHPSVTTYQKGNQAVRNEKYRYIHYNDGGEELYDETKDPLEWHNLAADPAMKTVISALKKELEVNFADPAQR